MLENHRDKNDGFICIESKNGLFDFGSNLNLCVKIVLMLNGKTKVWVENKNSETAANGDAIIIFPGQKYRFETQCTEEYILISANIKRLGELLSVLSSYSPVNNVIKGAANDAEIHSLARNAVKAYTDNKSEYRDTMLKGYVTALIGKLFSITALKKNEIEKTDTLSEIVSYCNLHFKEKLTLEVLERKLHISKYYISHIINERLGEGFNEYVNSIRINEACRLLIESEKNVQEISAIVGFGTVRSFDRAFKAKKGETAREYRKRNTEISKKD